MPGAAAGATLGEGVQATHSAERGLTDEPLYQGEPILAVAAVDELTAAEAIEKIDIEFEPLPFVVDPIESLRPGGANARTTGQRVDAPVGAARSARRARTAEQRRRRERRGAAQRRRRRGPAGEQRGPAPGAAAGAARGSSR